MQWRFELVFLVIALLACVVLGLMRPSHADDKPKFYLVLTIVMPADVRDIQQKFAAGSLEECWAEAKAAVQHGVPRHLADAGAVAIMAGCLNVQVAEADL